MKLDPGKMLGGGSIYLYNLFCLQKYLISAF